MKFDTHTPRVIPMNKLNLILLPLRIELTFFLQTLETQIENYKIIHGEVQVI